MHIRDGDVNTKDFQKHNKLDIFPGYLVGPNLSKKSHPATSPLLHDQAGAQAERASLLAEHLAHKYVK